MRFLGVDVGRRRIGLAWSDASAALARPWKTVLAAGTPAASATLVLVEARRYLDAAGEDLTGVVVGWPRRLNGEETHASAVARAFAEAVRTAGLPVRLQDERLSSRAAEERLATRVRDWRARKAQIDAEAAAIILQDFLDSRPAGDDLSGSATEVPPS
jgi:putative pre-16S rRNA nuclease